MSSNQPNLNPDLMGPPIPLLCLVEKPGRGRALITTALIKPGQVVMVDTPLLVYPSSLACFPIFCCRCFRVLPLNPFRCPSCSVARFCSDQCLSSLHPRLVCHALPELVSGKVTWPDDTLFLLSAYSLPKDEVLQLLSLHSNSSFPDESIDKLHSELASLLPANIVPLNFSRENTSSLISKEKNNSFALITPMGPKYECCGVAGARAYGLYLWSSMLNHDCMPNVCRFDYVDDPDREKNTDFVFRALHEIKEGSEICTSYVGVTRGYKERQKRLMEDYGFKCECERCKIESQWKGNQGGEEEIEEKEETEEEIEEKNEEKEETGEEIEEKNEEKEETEEEIEAKNEEENEEEDTEEKNEEVNEEETKEEIEEVNEEGEMEVGGEEQVMSEGGDDDFLICHYIERYICDCGGFLAPMPPSQDGV